MPTTEEQAKSILKDIGQEKLAEGETNGKLFEQIVKLDTEYPGGLRAYSENAKRLLQESKDGVNPFEGCVPEVPEGLALNFGDDECIKYEKIGTNSMKHAAFVLVAGGLGERLGYNGIKLELPVEVTTNTCYLEFYLQYLDALQKECGSTTPIPLAIMTSGDTHDKTINLLERNAFFNRPRSSIILMKQEKVPSITDNHGTFVKESPGVLETKPHGHGDVHQLLHSTGTASAWLQQGLQWVFFIQDTNAMVFNTTQGALGLSVSRSLELNSICITRKPKEAIGGITRLVGPTKTVTISVEYNQLDPLLRSINRQKGEEEVGDAPDSTGYSPYPGNINTLVFNLPPYVKQLEKSKGLMPEFVNPKYKDAGKTAFAKPTRLECMMQDYPKLLPAEAAVGFTTFDRLIAFSPVKNNTTDAAVKAQTGLEANCPSSAEAEFYKMQCKRLALCGAVIGKEAEPVTYQGIAVAWPPRVVLHPSFAPTQEALARKIGSNVRVATNSTLIVEGADINIQNLDLDGALVIKAVPGAKVTIKNLVVKNKGWTMGELPADAPESLTIRGYTLLKEECEELTFDKPGEYTIEK
eukprot:TRINITY_DN11963_c0_g1_i1.p1 TRINITY_DN11963_c0_g1~~TRINITY_DN11963_c0_g1_i1.p1  ORF type:complete len:600 (+),score=141.86 TRINITY_DN11963_c0_g1_i1:58-1800(+)